ncbi:hypothetical protein HYPSUDRAFT_61660 [Hypholoma sublateritium FD-334 SS-4]|uniref:Uncharacterized protein n=1 Tax=Hypholoma sublateritium (strain FD-334 SS-4) TaxID=945553 RepID=A0A0D2PDA4_HYPSF|nr:hypothetical protein HYPSUDRAFT_61660 [Hypholoma sublateritium FD-334 SS-4]
MSLWTSGPCQAPLEAIKEENIPFGAKRALAGIIPDRSPTASTVAKSSDETASITLDSDIESSLLTHKEDKAIRRLLESWMERLQLISVLVRF